MNILWPGAVQAAYARRTLDLMHIETAIIVIAHCFVVHSIGGAAIWRPWGRAAGGDQGASLNGIDVGMLLDGIRGWPYYAVDCINVPLLECMVVHTAYLVLHDNRFCREEEGSEPWASCIFVPLDFVAHVAEIFVGFHGD